MSELNDIAERFELKDNVVSGSAGDKELFWRTGQKLLRKRGHRYVVEEVRLAGVAGSDPPAVAGALLLLTDFETLLENREVIVRAIQEARADFERLQKRSDEPLASLFGQLLSLEIRPPLRIKPDQY